MDTLEHTFPMPEIESHKLEEFAEHLPHRSFSPGASEFLRANIWISMAAAIVIGGVVGFSFRRKPQVTKAKRRLKNLKAEKRH